MKPRILNMTVRGFLRVEEASLNFEKPVNCFLGLNRSGKSSLAAAPEWAITGLARGARFKTRAEGLINDDTSRAEVALSLDNDIVIRRSRTKTKENLRVVFKDHEEDKIPPAIASWMWGVNPDAYFSLSEDARITSVYDLVYRDKTDLGAQIQKALIDLGFTEDVSRLQAETVVLQGFKEACELAVDSRRDAKRRLDALRPEDPEKLKMHGTVDLGTISLDDMNTLLSECEGEKNTLLEKKGKVRASRPKPTINGELAKARGELANKEKEAKVDTASLENKRTATSRIRDSIQKEKDAKIEDRGRLNAILGQKTDFGASRCPIMPMDCPVSPKAREPIFTQHEAAREDAKARLPLLANDIATFSKKIEELSTTLREIRDTLDAAARAKSELPDLQLRVGNLEREREQASDQTAAEISEQIETLAQRIRAGQAMIEAKKKYDKAVAAASESEAKAAEIRAEIEVADRLTKALEPDGIRKTLVDKALGKFRERITESAAIFGDEIDLDEHLLPVLNGHRLQFQSGSESWLSKAIVQEAIAYLSGGPWLVLDEADILDGPNRGSFMAFLRHVATDYSTVLVFITVGDMEPRGSADELIDVWTVSDGKVTKLLAGKEAA